MGKLRSTNVLKGDYGELIFEHFSQQNNYAYISLEEIYNTLTPKNKLVFRYGRERIRVDIPEEIIEEIRKFSKPTNEREGKPYFVFDYLTVSIRSFFCIDKEKKCTVQNRPPKKICFNWVEIKTGKAKLTKNQKKYMEEAKIPVSVFRIPVEIPDEIEVLWDPKYHPERYKK